MSICRCGKEILWGIDPNGTRIPLDPRAPVYHVISFDPISNAYVVERAGQNTPVYHVTHFATCPKANEFSRSSRPKQPDPRSRAAGDR